MKKILILIAVLSFNAYSQKKYILGVQKVTFRTGPGVDNKIIKMLGTDTPVTVLKKGETWSLVKSGGDTEGYVLNRFLTKELPSRVKLDLARFQLDKIKNKYKDALKRKRDSDKELKKLREELELAKSKRLQTQKFYDELKLGAADYIGLKKSFDKMLINLKGKESKLKKLESQTSIYYIKWFLAGGGVLFLGWIIGLLSRKKKNYGALQL